MAREAAREAEKVVILTGRVELVNRQVVVEETTHHQRSRRDASSIPVTT